MTRECGQALLRFAPLLLTAQIMSEWQGPFPVNPARGARRAFIVTGIPGVQEFR